MTHEEKREWKNLAAQHGPACSAHTGFTCNCELGWLRAQLKIANAKKFITSLTEREIQILKQIAQTPGALSPAVSGKEAAHVTP